jgi:hypothetical protein
MDQSHTLGEVVKYNNKEYRVVRQVVSTSLFDPDDGEPSFTKQEEYYELKAGDGNIDFLVISSETTPYTGQSSAIRALVPAGEKP